MLVVPHKQIRLKKCMRAEDDNGVSIHLGLRLKTRIILIKTCEANI
jgi:hypothetical protein